MSQGGLVWVYGLQSRWANLWGWVYELMPPKSRPR